MPITPREELIDDSNAQTRRAETSTDTHPVGTEVQPPRPGVRTRATSSAQQIQNAPVLVRKHPAAIDKQQPATVDKQQPTAIVKQPAVEKPSAIDNKRTPRQPQAGPSTSDETNTWQGSSTEPTATTTEQGTSTETITGATANKKGNGSIKSNVSLKKLEIEKRKQKILQLKIQLEEQQLLVQEAEAEVEEALEQDLLTPPPVQDKRIEDWVTASHRSLPNRIEAPCQPEEQRKSDISELASALTQAIRMQPTTSRYHCELPDFHGAHQDFLAFKSAYNMTAASYTNIENLTRLRRCLKGKAKEAVLDVMLTTTKPEVIVQALESRFGRPDQIALAEIEKIRNLGRLSDNARDICIYSSKLQNAIATLKAVNRKYYLYNPELVKLMTENFSPTLRFGWCNYNATQMEDEPDLLKLARFLELQAKAFAPFAQPEDPTRHDQPHRKHRINYSNGEDNGHSSNKGYNNNYNPTAAKRKFENRIVPECTLCNKKGHKIQACHKFQEAEVGDRWKIAKEHNLCYRCLQKRRFQHRCQRKICNINGCTRSHHTDLHFQRQEGDKQVEVVSTAWMKKTMRPYLKMIPVTIEGPSGTVETYALLDDGSTVTLIDAGVAQKTGVEGPIDPLQIEAITDKTLKSNNSRRVKLTVRGAENSVQMFAHTWENLSLSPQTIENIDKCKHLADIADKVKYVNAKPTLLIGQDNWDLLLSSQTRRGRKDLPVASKTPLGWVLHGSHTRIIGHQVHTVNHLTDSTIEDQRMDEMLRHHFAIESLTIEAKRPQNDPEERAMKILQQTTRQRNDGHYETGLLWKNEDQKMPLNYDNTYRRLLTTENKIGKDEELKRQYHKQMNDLIEKDYAEKAPDRSENNRTWYLPHFAVVNPMKPGKIRIVHDAAAKTRGFSLNDFLLTGPDLLQSLPGVLMRFRQHPVGVTADIAEMFMQVKIIEADRDALRFLWREETPRVPGDFRMKSLIFGATSSPATAIYVKNINAEKYRMSDPIACDAIVRNHYVDDYLQSFPNEEEAIRTASRVKEIHQEAKFELRQWASNSKTVMKAMSPNSQEIETTNEESKLERLLGLVWRTQADQLAFNLDMQRLAPEIKDKQVPTKRETLKMVMSLFDPLGLAAPVTSKAKQILQQIWRQGTGWDDKITPELAEQWQEWKKHLDKLKLVRIPRSYLHYSDATEIQLHTFVDASESAYAAALYWRVTDANGQVFVSLVMGKSKVAPLKTTSIPRLELQAAVIGSKMANAVMEEHDRKPTKRFFWTDSRTVLAWLRTGSRSFKPYVAHRIAAIEENSKVNEWYWIPTKLNVADDATRNVPEDFNDNHRWFTGPAFLSETPEKWPTETVTPVEKTGEERLHVIRFKEPERSLKEATPNVDRFSRWEKYVRSTARVLQFIDLCRRSSHEVNYKRTLKNREKDPEWVKRNNKKSSHRSENQETNRDRFHRIDATTLKKAEQLLIRVNQRESFAKELSQAQDGQPIDRDSRLSKLAIEVNDGLIQLKSRIAEVQGVPERVKNPIVIDGKNKATQLYIDYIHRKLHHAGVETTVNECKQHYWIVKIRPTTRTVLSRCLPCRIRRTMPTVPSTGNHLKNRLAHHQRPFTYVGLDYFGPIKVTVGRGTQKRYVALFTCLTTRATHLEIAGSLSTSSTIMALRRLIARRGCPTEIWSDNGSNLQGADKELRRAALEATIDEASTKKIEWRFIPPGAPFMGGAWERMVRSVKVALATALAETSPTEEVLATLLAEAEYTVNSRPLTHVSVDPGDPEALTPNHFLIGGSGMAPVPGAFSNDDLVGRAGWRASQRLADHFWARWLKEFLPELQNRREPRGKGPEVNVGNVVLIADPNLPRNVWPRGIIDAVYPGPDGEVRAVDVRTKGGVMRRPTKRLVILPTDDPVLHGDE